MPHDIHAIAFDLDGTLVDSAPDVAQALNHALAQVGLPPFDLGTVRSWIGDGPDATIVRALHASTARGDADAPRPGAERDATALQMRASFDAATLGAPLDHGTVFEGIATLLQELARRWPLAVVTNKPTVLAHAVLTAAGLAPHFRTICGADTPAQRKPSPLLLQQAARNLGVQPEQLLLVGDGVPDMQAAHDAGCAAAWVHWGYGSLPEPATPAPGALQAPMPLWQLRTPADLLGCLNSAKPAQ